MPLYKTTACVQGEPYCINNTYGMIVIYEYVNMTSNVRDSASIEKPIMKLNQRGKENSHFGRFNKGKQDLKAVVNVFSNFSIFLLNPSYVLV